MKKLLLVGILFLGTLSYGGCNINIFYKNTSNQKIIIHKKKNLSGDARKSSVRSKNGSWKSLSNRSWNQNNGFDSIGLNPNDNIGTTYKATFGCNSKRRYRIVYSCRNTGGVFTKYYPSTDGWTKNQTVNIKVGELCEEVQRNREIFRYPKVNTRMVDWCKNWGQGCGEPAATNFCVQKGFVRASVWEQYPDVGNTLVLGDNKVCDMPGCDGFKSITCIK